MDALNSDEQRFLITVGPPDVDGAADRKQQGHGASGQRQVLAKKPSAGDPTRDTGGYIKSRNASHAIAAPEDRKEA